jgi:AraC family transcriptional regulator of adaptative response / DNA-3-methyladenine glycosylase II
MTLDQDSCYRALSARDARFDGRFFVGVSSTRIYCRPVCTVRTPKRENCHFFPSAAAAEVRGYRPCLRCRPELAPGLASIDATTRLAQAAANYIENGALEDHGIEHLASRIGVTSRHLRRIFESEFGVAPIEYAQTQRLLLAKRLLTDTDLPVTDVALASGFRSLRRFNALIKSRYRMAPRAMRRDAAPDTLPATLRFLLPYRPPYAWDAQLAFLGARAIDGVESVTARAYRRSLAISHRGAIHSGWIDVQKATRRPALSVTLSASLARAVPQVLAATKHAFDLTCDPDEVTACLGPLAVDEPGLRVPGTFDGFELAVRAIIGQQISVRGARTLLGRLASTLGTEGVPTGAPGVTRLFPSPQRIAAATTAEMAAIGVTTARARTLAAVAGATARGELDLRPGADVEAVCAALEAIPGIGTWTSQYIAMRALGWPDAFLASDLVVLKALGETKARNALARSEAWRPWRAYAVMHLWRQA